MTEHVRIVRDIQELPETGDRSDDELRADFPILGGFCVDSIRRLIRFNREQWWRERYPRPDGAADFGAWRSEGVIDHDGLEEHARTLLCDVQRELAAREPRLDRHEALELSYSRKVALEALIRLGNPDGNEYAKTVQSDLAAPHAALAVCVGSNYEHVVEGFRIRSEGCLAIFEDAPFGRGYMWPSWCPACRPKNGKRNPRRAQERAFKRKLAEYRSSRTDA